VEGVEKAVWREAQHVAAIGFGCVETGTGEEADLGEREGGGEEWGGVGGKGERLGEGEFFFQTGAGAWGRWILDRGFGRRGQGGGSLPGKQGRGGGEADGEEPSGDRGIGHSE
jgi:hypothetical protein